MAESGSRKPASDDTSEYNLGRILAEEHKLAPGTGASITKRLRQELEQKGLKGFKKGGKVGRTGVYKLHKGETVKAAPKKAAVARKPGARPSGRKR